MALTVSYAGINAVLLVIFHRIANLTREELMLLSTVTLELKKLQRTLLKILSVLAEAERKHIKDVFLTIWLMELRDMAYEAEDILDEYNAELIRRQAVRGLCSCLSIKKLVTYRSLAHKIRSLRQNLTIITQEKEIKIGELDDAAMPSEMMEKEETTSFINQPSLLGREADKENIVRMLLEPGRGLVHVLPVIGISGVGKTALARLVYNDERVKEYFPLRIWISVSDQLDAKRITRELIEYTAGEKSSFFTNLNLLQLALESDLKGKRFLLVLDNVLNENQVEWESLQGPLTAGEQGSIILITTQNKQVADAMGTMEPYFLKQLSDDDCWRLLRYYSFDGDGVIGHPKLEAIGREIAKKMKGLPFGAKRMGRFLRHRLDVNVWREILATQVWQLPPGASDVLASLKLSFEQLPHQLKRCFAFCSLFPRGHKLEEDNLVEIWMAHNLIQPQGVRRREDIGREYMDDLVSRGFFQRSGGSLLMHEAINDLARAIATDEFALVEDDGSSIELPATIRHVTWSKGSITREHFRSLRSMRTLLFLGRPKFRIRTTPYVFCRLRSLRALDLSNSTIKFLPRSISRLKHLRYLNLSNTGIKKLPGSLPRLYHLQTLRLENCPLRRLPKNMSNLINLRHLKADAKLVSEIRGVGRLTSLQELEAYNVYKKRGHDIGQLGGLTQLRESLCIQNLQNVKDEKQAKDAELNNKQHLNILRLSWSNHERSCCARDGRLDERVLESLQPHPNVKELDIGNYGGITSPSWMTGEYLTNMESICICNCKRWFKLPSLGELQLLKHLKIGGMDELRQFTQVSGFPSLETLYIHDMPKLGEWSAPDANQDFFPCLRELWIENCPRLTALPSLPPTLTHLSLYKVGLTTLPDWQGSTGETENPSLTFLRIYGCPKLISMGEGMLRNLISLQELHIIYCPNLQALPAEMRSLTSLKVLWIEECPRLTALPSLPPTLTHLSLYKVGLTTLPDWQGSTGETENTSLTSLRIYGCPKLISMGEGMLRNLISLQELHIIYCPNLQALPAEMRSLTSLKVLFIVDCPAICSLPAGGLNTSLEHLVIRGCDQLNRRCRRESGADWQLISGIPKLDIEDEHTDQDGS